MKRRIIYRWVNKTIKLDSYGFLPRSLLDFLRDPSASGAARGVELLRLFTFLPAVAASGAGSSRSASSVRSRIRFALLRLFGASFLFVLSPSSFSSGSISTGSSVDCVIRNTVAEKFGRVLNRRRACDLDCGWSVAVAAGKCMRML